MFYLIKHLTRFRYSESVSESLLEARVMPRTEGEQRCLAFDLITHPRSQILEYLEHTGNVVHHFNIPRRHSQLLVQSQAIVEMDVAPRPDYALTPEAWQELDRQIIEGDFWEMLAPSRYTEQTELLRALAEELGAERRGDPYSLVCELNEKVYNTFEYAPLSTHAESTIDEALRQRKGVCQDFTHVLIALLRLTGIPARYVSGYLYRSAISRHQQTEGATHAWVEAYLPQIGWLGIDPSNNMLAGHEHIRVAVGRDYADVPPTKGIFKGLAESTLSVRVEVTRYEEAPRLSLDPWDVESDETSGQPTAPAVDFILQSYRAHQLQQQQWAKVLVQIRH